MVGRVTSDAAVLEVPQHIAIIMDGNGRWAQRRLLPRHFGHRAGLRAARAVVEACVKQGIQVLTLFAFSSENWSRPQHEISQILTLFLTALRGEIKRLQAHRVRLRIIGERQAFSATLQRRILETEQLTAANDGLLLQIAANYGGRWDIMQATRILARRVAIGALNPDAIDEAMLTAALSFADQPDPDLFIRTGGEQRLSNFLLWQSAYAELHFSDCLWPDFDANELERALCAFAGRQRRFGKTGEQLAAPAVNAHKA